MLSTLFATKKSMHMSGTLGHAPKLVAEYILWKSADERDPITPMQLLKLVYIAHGWMLGLHSRPLLNEPVEAWQYGPVVASVYRAYREYGGGHISACPETQPDGFDADEMSVMDQVWSNYHTLTGLQLSALTHAAGTPWQVTYEAGRNRVISNDLIEQHYRTLAQKK